MPPAPRRNLTSDVAGRLSKEIIAGKLPPNARLPTEHAMMEAYGVSRTVVREAISALRAEGLVETRRGSGAYVAGDARRRPFRIDPEALKSVRQVVDVLELRVAVEVEAAGLAAERRSKAHVNRLKRICAAFAKLIETGDPATGLDYDFHVAIGDATGNPYFASFLSFIGQIIIPRQTVQFDTVAAAYAPPLQKIRQEHEAIAHAIAAADVAAARRAMRVHLSRSRDRYCRLLGERAV